MVDDSKSIFVVQLFQVGQHSTTLASMPVPVWQLKQNHLCSRWLLIVPQLLCSTNHTNQSQLPAYPNLRHNLQWQNPNQIHRTRRQVRCLLSPYDARVWLNSSPFNFFFFNFLLDLDDKSSENKHWFVSNASCHLSLALFGVWFFPLFFLPLKIDILNTGCYFFLTVKKAFWLVLKLCDICVKLYLGFLCFIFVHCLSMAKCIRLD